MSKTLIVTGPQGCGKTRLAGEIAAHFGLSSIVDEWDGRAALPTGALVLTNIPKDQLPAGCHTVMDFDEVRLALRSPAS